MGETVGGVGRWGRVTSRTINWGGRNSPGILKKNTTKYNEKWTLKKACTTWLRGAYNGPCTRYKVRREYRKPEKEKKLFRMARVFDVLHSVWCTRWGIGFGRRAWLLGKNRYALANSSSRCIGIFEVLLQRSVVLHFLHFWDGVLQLLLVDKAPDGVDAAPFGAQRAFNFGVLIFTNQATARSRDEGDTVKA